MKNSILLRLINAYKSVFTKNLIEVGSYSNYTSTRGGHGKTPLLRTSDEGKHYVYLDLWYVVEQQLEHADNQFSDHSIVISSRWYLHSMRSKHT
jgi:hypothetical protein